MLAALRKSSALIVNIFILWAHAASYTVLQIRRRTGYVQDILPDNQLLNILVLLLFWDRLIRHFGFRGAGALAGGNPPTRRRDDAMTRSVRR